MGITIDECSECFSVFSSVFCEARVFVSNEIGMGRTSTKSMLEVICAFAVSCNPDLSFCEIEIKEEENSLTSQESLNIMGN